MRLSTGNSTSIIPFYASSIHRADSSGAICLLTDIAASLSRRPAICSISMRDFDRAFSRRPLRGVSCPRRGRDDSSESGTNLRATTVSPSLSASREGDTEDAGNPPLRFFRRHSALPLHPSASDQGTFSFFRQLPNSRAELRHCVIY